MLSKPPQTMAHLALLAVILLLPSSGSSRSAPLNACPPAAASVGALFSLQAILRSPSDDPDSNDTPGAATVIAIPHEGDYAVDPAGDIDWYRMELSANTLLHIYSERINDSQLDPEARFYGPHEGDGTDLNPTEWIVVDDDSHGNMQPDIRIVIPASGFYFLRMAYYQNDPTRGNKDDKELGRADTGQYRLFVHALADQPDIWVDPQNLDFGLSPNDSVSAYISVHNQGNAPLHVSSITDDQPWLSLGADSLTVPPDSSLDVTASANSTGLGLGTHVGTITMICNDPDQGFVTIAVVLTVTVPDTNNTPAEATQISVPHTGDYVIGPVGDVDWYRMHLDVGTAWLIYTERIGDSRIDPEAWFYGPHAADGADIIPTTWIANDDDSHGGLQPQLNVSVTESGYYFLRIAHFWNNPLDRLRDDKVTERAATGEYRLFIQPGTASGPAIRSPSLFLGLSPNPSSDRVDLFIRLSEESSVRVGIYDLAGRLMQCRDAEVFGPGDHILSCEMRGMENGTYLVRVRAGGVMESRRILVRR